MNMRLTDRQFLLTSVGFHDWQIIEASARVGGRVHTSYLNGTKPDQYQYQEYAIPPRLEKLLCQY
jgi:monoamine oxidase